MADQSLVPFGFCHPRLLRRQQRVAAPGAMLAPGRPSTCGCPPTTNSARSPSSVRRSRGTPRHTRSFASEPGPLLDELVGRTAPPDTTRAAIDR